MLKVYGDYRSGNCYKIKLMLHLLDQPYEWIAINILRGETRSEEFLKKNPNGKIPVLELRGRLLSMGVQRHPELRPTAAGSFRPIRACALRCCSGSSSSSTATSRSLPWRGTSRSIWGCRKGGARRIRGQAARRLSCLNVMEQQLLRAPYLVGDHYSIADVALYAYTHVAEEGGFDLGVSSDPSVAAARCEPSAACRHVRLRSEKTGP